MLCVQHAAGGVVAVVVVVEVVVVIEVLDVEVLDVEVVVVGGGLQIGPVSAHDEGVPAQLQAAVLHSSSTQLLQVLRA
jgi:hypothetical protein